MTRTEAKQAFKEGAPIICRINGIEHEYQHISAVVYRKNKRTAGNGDRTV